MTRRSRAAAPRRAAGSITAYLPEIGGAAAGLRRRRLRRASTARPFADLSDREVESYVGANVAAVTAVCRRAGGVDAALANHLVMGPAILARAADAVGPFAAKVHGSALSYTVMPHPRFLPYAREGIAAARAVLVGSRHTAESLWETVAVDGLEAKTRLGPPGVDVVAFSPLRAGAEPAATELEALAATLASAPSRAASVATSTGGSGRGPQLRGAPTGPRVIFVGKLIVSKGCDLLLAAWPLVAARHPGARLLMVGFGEYREGLAASLGGTRRRRPRRSSRGRPARLGARGRGGGAAELPRRPSSQTLRPATRRPRGAAAGSIDLAGRLEYARSPERSGRSDAMVVPSTFPGGIRDGRRRGRIGRGAADLRRRTPASPRSPTARGRAAGRHRRADVVPARPRCGRRDRGSADRWLALPEADRATASTALVAAVRARWSWESVARTALAASPGDLRCARSGSPEPESPSGV